MDGWKVRLLGSSESAEIIKGGEFLVDVEFGSTQIHRQDELRSNGRNIWE